MLHPSHQLRCCCCYAVLLLWWVFPYHASSWIYSRPIGTINRFHYGSVFHRSAALVSSVSKRNNDDEKDDDDDSKENMDQQLGMAEAMKKLEELGTGVLKEESTSGSLPPPIPFQVSTEDLMIPTDTPVVSLESEVKLYKELVGEVELNEDSDSYLEMMKELGASNKQTFDTYSTVLQDLGGTLQGFVDNSNNSNKMIPASDETTSIPNAISAEQLLALQSEKASASSSTERWMELALQDAMNDVTLNHPDLRRHEILSDADLRKEIENIFAAGNEKLLQSIAEIKEEQRQLAQQKQKQATSQQHTAVEQQEEGQKRLLAAETAMQQILRKVHSEKTQLEQAVVDLNTAQTKLEQNVVYQLGGLPKQAALVGVVLFSVRSILDTVTALTTDDATVLTTALLQGGLALACAILVAILK
jgi:hypothetical protein